MPPFPYPPVVALRRLLGQPIVWIQTYLVAQGASFELRHVHDVGREAASLRALNVEDLSGWADTTEDGAFRPNKAAPNLRRGWRCEGSLDAQLESVLEALYPGSLVDWYAVQSTGIRVTSFREFTQRQSGLYRSTQQLSDTQASMVTQAVCDVRFCLRRRIWSAPGLTAEESLEKSVVPCLEPCALLLEFARRAQQLSSAEPWSLQFSRGELESIQVALETALEHPRKEIREGDSTQPANPRRIRLVLERLGRAMSAGESNKEA